MPGEKIVSINNRHIESCGSPPEIDLEEYEYFSYFENGLGDQSLLVLDKEAGVVIVYIADAGWDNPVKIPVADIIQNRPSELNTPGILPNESEATWLKACKKAIESRLM